MNEIKNQLLEKVKNKEITVGIIGLGYVGLPLLLSFAESQIRVLGFDIDIKKINMLKNRKSYIKHINYDRISKVFTENSAEVTSDFSRTSEADALILCVPTPLNKHREPDLSFIVDTLESILPYLRKGQIISLESTTYPGTTDEILKSRIESKGFKVGEDIFLVFSPEREDPGNKNFSTKSIPKVIGGTTPNCLEIGQAIYSQVIERVVPVSSTKAAELTKLLENIYRAVNIGLVNEMKIVADKMGIDIWEVIEAASTKPFGFTPFYPGPGWGGHCIPIDPFYLTWKAKEYGTNTRFIELAGEINTQMPEWVLSKASDALNQRQKAINGSKILVLGIAYKKNVDDMRESPSVELMELLRNKGADLCYSDPFFSVFPEMREHDFKLNSMEITPELLSKMDCVIIATDHDLFDYELILKYSNLVVDTRCRYRKAYPNVMKA
jgi:UDP-N-acetyl-D-glucosamine dehydrogenase